MFQWTIKVLNWALNPSPWSTMTDGLWDPINGDSIFRASWYQDKAERLYCGVWLPGIHSNILLSFLLPTPPSPLPSPQQGKPGKENPFELTAELPLALPGGMKNCLQRWKQGESGRGGRRGDVSLSYCALCPPALRAFSYSLSCSQFYPVIGMQGQAFSVLQCGFVSAVACQKKRELHCRGGCSEHTPPHTHTIDP